jgi:hypothetical protein
MSERTQQLTPVVLTLKTLKPKQRKAMVNLLNPDHVKGFTEVAVNIVKNTVPLSHEHTETCKKWKKPLKSLALKGSIKKKKKILQQGGFLGAILPILATVLGSVLNG